MGAKAQMTRGKSKQAAPALVGSDKRPAQGKVDQAIEKAEIAAQDPVNKLAEIARKDVDKYKSPRLLILISTMIAATMLLQNVGLAQANRGDRGGERVGGGGGRENQGGSSQAQNRSEAARPAGGVVRNGVGAENQPNRPAVARTQPTFVRNNFSSEHLGTSAATQGGSTNRTTANFSRNLPQNAVIGTSAISRSVTAYRPTQRINTNSAILHNQQLSGSHWNGGWNNNHNNSYWANRSFFFGGSSPFGYGNGSYAYRSPYAYGLGGLGYGYGGYGLGGYGLGGYGLGGYGLGYGLGGMGLGGYGLGGYGYGGFPSYGYYDNGDNVYAVASAQDNGAPPDSAANADPAPVPAASPEQPADDALDFAGHGELDFKAGRYDGAVRNWKHALVDDPNNGALVLMLAQGMFAVGQFAQAAGATQMAMQMLPPEKWGTVVENYQELYGNVGDYTTQIRALEKARLDKPADPALRFLLGFQFGYLGHPKPAVTELDKALELNSKDEGARKVRDLIAAKMQDDPSAPAAVPATDQPRTGDSSFAPPQAAPDGSSNVGAPVPF